MINDKPTKSEIDALNNLYKNVDVDADKLINKRKNMTTQEQIKENLSSMQFKGVEDKKSKELITTKEALTKFAEFLKTVPMDEDKKLEIYRVFRDAIGFKANTQKTK